ncbi:MAG: glycerophosphodiester phosphodiesterase [Thermoleophilia bacterium]|nr:glycerophosphodiester phosphodiesterase [Gaiellaceae bacterium]MDW8338914.1 glycerophosphodiester phosphodiesterase [Thermoleophilia bacterium]
MSVLRPRDGSPLRIGHRGAAALAPENTIRSFRAARAAGVDAVELDLLRLDDGSIVVAHSNDLREVSHGTARGSVVDKDLEALRRLCPELPTLEDALVWFVDEAPELVLHADVKSPRAVAEVAAALERRGLAARAYVTSTNALRLRALARRRPDVRCALTFPRSLLGLSDGGDSVVAPLARAGLVALRAALPLLVPMLLGLSRASGLSLHHSLVSARAVERAHARGAAVIAWTVDDPETLERVLADGVDGVVTNDPRIFGSTLRP